MTLNRIWINSAECNIFTTPVPGCELCSQYGINAEEVVETWMAFSVSNNIQGITLESLAQMERKEFAKKLREIPTPKGPSRQGVKNSSVVVYHANKDPVMYPFIQCYSNSSSH